MRWRDLAFEVEDRVKAYIPPRQRRKLAMMRLKGRLLTARFRALPDALIIGGQRCGTSSLYKYLDRHPACAASLRKEVGYFSVFHHLGETWYRGHFPLTAGRTSLASPGRRLTFEATPDYLLDPRAAQRAAALVPDAKIIALLRSPIDRAVSHYEHARRHGHESLSFIEAVQREDERVAPGLERLRKEPELPLPAEVRNFSYLTRGRYADQLRPWLNAFPTTSILILRSEDLFEDPAAVYDRVLDFLGLPPWRPLEFKNFSYTRNRTPDRSQISDTLRAELAAYYHDHNLSLFRLIGRDMGWSADPTAITAETAIGER